MPDVVPAVLLVVVGDGLATVQTVAHVSPAHAKIRAHGLHYSSVPARCGAG